MRNRLVFPSGGKETKYLWDKYNLWYSGIYKWGKYNVNRTYEYLWYKYYVKVDENNTNAGKYYWDKYSVNQRYTWDIYYLDGEVLNITGRRYNSTKQISVDYNYVGQVYETYQLMVGNYTFNYIDDEGNIKSLYFGDGGYKLHNMLKRLTDLNGKKLCKYSNIISFKCQDYYNSDNIVEYIITGNTYLEFADNDQIYFHNVLPGSVSSWQFTEDNPDWGYPLEGFYYKSTDSFTEKTYEKGSYNYNSVDGDVLSNNDYGDYVWLFKGCYKDNTKYFIFETKEQGPGRIAGSINTGNINSYPHDGVYDNSYYKYTGATSQKGTFIEKVSSRNGEDFPQDGEQNGYWYVFTNFVEDTYIKGNFIGPVYSSNRNEYPDNDIKDNYWYVFNREVEYVNPGSFIENVNSFYKNTYPLNGEDNNYWYIYSGYEENGPYKGDYLSQVESANNQAFPQDGIQGDYYYVSSGTYEGYKLQINDDKLMGAVKYKQNVNPQTDFTFGNVASSSVGFVYDNSNDDFQQYQEAEYFDYYVWQNSDTNWRLINRYWIDDVKASRKTVEVSAYDTVIKTETYIDEFIDTTTYPAETSIFRARLILGLELDGNDSGYSLVNSNYIINNNFQAINITARQVLQYIAELQGAFVVATVLNGDERITTRTFKAKDISLDKTKYKKYVSEKFTVAPIDGIVVKTTDDDLGVSVGNVDGNCYIIKNNPLFYSNDEETVRTALVELLERLTAISYTPGTIELLEDFGIECGDIITVDGNTFYVMSKEMDGTGVKLECFGNKVRDKQASPINSEIVALRGKTNELFRDLETTKSTITDVQAGLQSQITQTANEINTRITNEVNGLESTIQQTESSITSKITEQGNTITEIRQDLDGISLTYNSENGTASITIGNVTIPQLVDGNYVDKVVAGIDLTGYVTFHSLETAGATIINGSNITTGTIEADRLNLTGSIAWGDLTSGCKDKIASYASGLPDYIHSTYIDSTSIYSPSIYGAEIYGGEGADGYVKLSSTGMNFHSKAGGQVVGMGYTLGKNLYPYFVLGSGVDGVGTNRGLIKKYTNGIWIGDSDSINDETPSGTGIFINFSTNKIYKYLNGVSSEIT